MEALSVYPWAAAVRLERTKPIERRVSGQRVQGICPVPACVRISLSSAQLSFQGFEISFVFNLTT